ncbi:MAG: hypothetical protein VX475_13735, partial [Myxococcota bacterium]|nr:hypothetical protein [Myxococcota bacterium]
MGFALTAMLLSACGGNNEPNNTQNNTSTDLCAEVTCERGVCEPTSGECSNASDCGGEDAN